MPEELAVGEVGALEGVGAGAAAEAVDGTVEDGDGVDAVGLEFLVAVEDFGFVEVAVFGEFEAYAEGAWPLVGGDEEAVADGDGGADDAGGVGDGEGVMP